MGGVCMVAFETECIREMTHGVRKGILSTSKKEISEQQKKMYSKRIRFPSIEWRESSGGYRKFVKRAWVALAKACIGLSLISWCTAHSTGQSGWPNPSSKHARRWHWLRLNGWLIVLQSRKHRVLERLGGSNVQVMIQRVL